ncbi:MAG TPA: SNF2-related protein, partial [Pyrinomonadaceae bacterium]|nr:SNF2-related protein [Pyrinomonadaceae bacterium]
FLAEFESPNYEWNLANAESCLTALSELEKPRKEDKLVVEWTKGQKLKLLGNINFENFSLAVKGTNNWFEVEGKAKVNEDLVLSMKDLSGLLSQNNGNFVELSDGQFIAITEKLRKHLQSLSAVLDDKNRLHNLRSGILEDFADELENFKADKAWKEHLKKLKDAQKFIPELPATFEADLRPYQIEGFEWLSRLANWGVGACLADDMGLGKAQPLDAKILTKNGWKLMGKIEVGDEIIGSKGKPIKVLGVYPQGEKDIYKVTFSDKSSTECCQEHLWTVNTPLRNSRNYSPKIMSLKEITDFGLRDKAGNCNWFIPIVEAVEFEAKDFYLDPYLLGVLIGDGGLTRGVAFSSVDEEIISEVGRLLPNNYNLKHKDRCDYQIVKIKGGKFDANFVVREVKLLNLNKRSENKHIPFDYLHASVEQRISLLQGLLDTDGYCSKESTVQFYSTSEQLADDVIFLVRSLGGLVRKSIKKTTHRDCYVLTLALPDNIKPFRLSRKAMRYQPRVKYKPSRAIISVEYVGKKQAQCIKVDAEDSLYVTDDFILTHNTLQALAVLVERAEKGAALVVAPVSVCRNWMKEARRFAPTLNFHLFGDGDRKLQVESLGKYDVLVTSYNLLQLEEELFTAQNFATIVLDEAQAIKNRATKRSKTVMNLQGDFRLITTGTPIENHLGELWNLFNFINPGLLGNHDFFNEKFALPIERSKDDATRKTLQRLIKPFLLRRRKNQVLDDLPEKTEIVLTVEMSAEER